MPDFFVHLQYTAFVAQAFPALTLLLFLGRLDGRADAGVLSEFRAVAWVLLGGAAVQLVTPMTPGVQVLQTLVLLALYHRLFRPATPEGRPPLWTWLLGLPAAGVAVAGPLLDWPWTAALAVPVVVLILWISFLRRLYLVSEFNTEGAGLILRLRRSLTLTVTVVHGAALILVPWGGYLNPVFQVLILPLSGLYHSWALGFWETEAHSQRDRQVQTLEKNLVSLFEFMVAIGNAIAERLEMDKVLSFVVSSAVKASGADGGAVYLVDEFEDVLKLKALDGDFPPPYPVPAKVKLKTSTLTEYLWSTPIPLGKTVVGECAVGRQGILIRDTRDDPRMVQNAQLDQVSISSMILVPLLQGKKVFGVLAVVSRRSDVLFGPEQFSQISTFADYTSLTINSLFTYLQLLEKQDLEREVGIAAQIQGELLPRRLPQVSSVSLAAWSQPAKGVSGDYYDVIKIRKGQILLAVCDVAGKGIPASLVMVMIRTIIHLVAHQPGMTVDRILDVVNWGIAGKVSLDRFATMTLLVYDFASRRLEYSNAAHHPLLIYRAAAGAFEAFDTEGLPIGLEKKTKYAKIDTVLQGGDIVVLYTDGIIEAMNEQGTQYGLEALQKVLAANAGLDTAGLKQAVIEDMGAFVGKGRQHDDQTFVLMKVEG